MKSTDSNRVLKRTFWVAFAFYILIAFEFFYMVSPFALYFYSIYRPGLNFMNESVTFAWLSSTFLPHFINNTKSPVLNILMPAGIVLTVLGISGFVLGAAQVYYSKLTRKKAVTGGIYRLIRHPQYAALIIAGFGLLILWPRYLALLSYITMLFFYFGLARLEEKECERKFGQDYLEYKNKTAMFFPGIDRLPRIPVRIPFSGVIKGLIVFAFYLITCAIGVQVANGIRSWSLDKLHATYQADSVNLAVYDLSAEKIDQIMAITTNHPVVQSRLKNSGAEKTINYLTPDGWSASEIPMRQVAWDTGGHFSEIEEEITIVKIIFTKAEQRAGAGATGSRILLNTTDRTPIMEVRFDTVHDKVLEINDPFENNRLGSVPLPLY